MSHHRFWRRAWVQAWSFAIHLRNLNLLGRYSFTASTPTVGALRPLRDLDASELDEDDGGASEVHEGADRLAAASITYTGRVWTPMPPETIRLSPVM
ncbi:hypothetical protein Pmi06nite_84180 [Planotetraspora mira]|uniref:Uncharacterized protein n=1 Tax=Planotetraspora mira TaxID=58121 RepID=A0A8J3TYN1_9ACTN|nr:hypothetical protein Pmi06nite_84180 [Planotetraspora mira]